MNQTPENELWEIAEAFRLWVTRELNAIENTERESLRGDYLFVVDAKPRFVVVVELDGAWSGKISVCDGVPEIQIEGPIQYNAATLSALLGGAARSTITTDSVTLNRLLKGTLRATVSFVSGRVKIAGDLAAFMRLVANLKRQGVGPVRGAGTSLSESSLFTNV